MRISILSFFAAAALLVASSEIDAQVYVRKVISCGGTGQAGYTVAIDGETKLAVADSLFQAIREGYLFSERAAEVVDFIRGRISGTAEARASVDCAPAVILPSTHCVPSRTERQ